MSAAENMRRRFEEEAHKRPQITEHGLPELPPVDDAAIEQALTSVSATLLRARERDRVRRETQLFINGIHCPRPDDTEWKFTQRMDIDIGTLFSNTWALRPKDSSMELDIWRGDKHFHGYVTHVQEFRTPSGMVAINLTIDMQHPTDDAQRELLRLAAARKALPAPKRERRGKRGNANR